MHPDVIASYVAQMELYASGKVTAATTQPTAGLQGSDTPPINLKIKSCKRK
jgi:hypothetical protein